MVIIINIREPKQGINVVLKEYEDRVKTFKNIKAAEDWMDIYVAKGLRNHYKAIDVSIEFFTGVKEWLNYERNKNTNNK